MSKRKFNALLANPWVYQEDKEAHEALKKGKNPSFAPHPRRKLTPEIWDYIVKRIQENEELTYTALSEDIRNKFGVKLSAGYIGKLVRQEGIQRGKTTRSKDMARHTNPVDGLVIDEPQSPAVNPLAFTTDFQKAVVDYIKSDIYGLPGHKRASSIAQDLMAAGWRGRGVTAGSVKRALEESGDVAAYKKYILTAVPGARKFEADIKKARTIAGVKKVLKEKMWGGKRKAYKKGTAPGSLEALKARRAALKQFAPKEHAHGGLGTLYTASLPPSAYTPEARRRALETKLKKGTIKNIRPETKEKYGIGEVVIHEESPGANPFVNSLATRSDRQVLALAKAQKKLWGHVSGKVLAELNRRGLRPPASNPMGLPTAREFGKSTFIDGPIGGAAMLGTLYGFGWLVEAAMRFIGERGMVNTKGMARVLDRVIKLGGGMALLAFVPNLLSRIRFLGERKERIVQGIWDAILTLNLQDAAATRSIMEQLEGAMEQPTSLSTSESGDTDAEDDVTILGAVPGEEQAEDLSSNTKQSPIASHPFDNDVSAKVIDLIPTEDKTEDITSTDI